MSGMLNPPMTQEDQKFAPEMLLDYLAQHKGATMRIAEIAEAIGLTPGRINHLRHNDPRVQEAFQANDIHIPTRKEILRKRTPDQVRIQRQKAGETRRKHRANWPNTSGYQRPRR